MRLEKELDELIDSAAIEWNDGEAALFYEEMLAFRKQLLGALVDAGFFERARLFTLLEMPKGPLAQALFTLTTRHITDKDQHGELLDLLEDSLWPKRLGSGQDSFRTIRAVNTYAHFYPEDLDESRVQRLNDRFGVLDPNSRWVCTPPRVEISIQSQLDQSDKAAQEMGEKWLPEFKQWAQAFERPVGRQVISGKAVDLVDSFVRPELSKRVHWKENPVWTNDHRQPVGKTHPFDRWTIARYKEVK